jgi:hypothetical protein
MKNDAEAAKGPGVKRRVNPFFSLVSDEPVVIEYIRIVKKKKTKPAKQKRKNIIKIFQPRTFLSKKTKIGARASPKNRCECSGAGSVGLATSRRIIHLVIIIIIIIFNDCITTSPASLIFFIFFTQKIKQKFSILGKKKRV